jgi:DNA-binding HxlR family transcriptional regulator
MSNLLIKLTKRGWALPVMAALETGAIARAYPLSKNMHTSPVSIKAALDHLTHLGLLKENAGHGHPLRPDYLRTPLGEALGPRALEIHQIAEQQNLLALLRKRWALPIVGALDGARSFGELRRFAAPATDRALSLSLKDLASVKLVRRKVIAERLPPATLYLPTPMAQRLRMPLCEFMR